MSRALSVLLILCPGLAGAEVPRLALPVDCTLGETCFIQSYLDHEPGPGAADFACGPLSNDGHKGTDFALISLAQMQAGVDVYPAQHGRVVAVRDGMADVHYVPGTDLGGRDCGNGVLIDHGDGWQTQYCHLKTGSIRVGKGEPVFETTVLGQVGLSGRTQFPHLHIALRKDGAPIDPFRPNGRSGCSADTTDALWREPVAYVPGGLIAAGFAPEVPDYAAVKAGRAAAARIPPDAGGVVLWGYLFGGRAGDVIAFDFTGADGLSFAHSVTLETTQVQLFRAAGKRRTLPQWPTGTVTGTVRLIRGDTEIGRMPVVTRIGH